MNFPSSPVYFRRQPWSWAGLILGAGLLGGCAPTVNLATPQPVKIDVGIRLDIYQKTPPTKTKSEQSNIAVAANRRMRAGQIQQLKSEHEIGETRDGYLAVVKPPGDAKQLADVKKLVDDENADRSFLYLANAQSQSKPMEIIETEYAKLWSDRAYPGEWIQKEDGTWIQK